MHPAQLYGGFRIIFFCLVSGLLEKKKKKNIIVIGLNCIDDDASVYIIEFYLLLSNIHVRQPFPTSLAVKELEKKPALAGFEPGRAFHTAWQTQSLTIRPSGQ